MKLLPFLNFNFADFQLSDIINNPPKKNLDHVVIAFNTVDKEIRFWHNSKLDFANSDVKTFSYRAQFMTEAFLGEFNTVCAEYFKSLKPDLKLAFYLVLPDNVVMMDNVNVPQMPAKALLGALNTQVQNLFKNSKDLHVNHYLLTQNKQTVTYLLTITKETNLTELYRTTATYKATFKHTSFSANCLVNGALHFKPNLRKRNFILLDIKDMTTEVAVCVKGQTVGFSSIMLGYEHLMDDKVLQENMQYNHDVAELAIINAKEKAKMKKLTVSEDDEEELDETALQLMQQNYGQITEDVDAINEVLDAAEQQRDDNALMNTAEDLATTAEEKEMDEQYAREDAEYDEEMRKHELELQQMMETRKRKVFTRKIPKKLPKFMLRDDPTTAEGFVYENFRMFIKWALLYNKQLKQQDFMPAMDCVVVNLPEELSFVVDMANTNEDGNALPFEYIGNLGGENISQNLDMIGALYCGVFNKRENF